MTYHPFQYASLYKKVWSASIIMQHIYYGIVYHTEPCQFCGTTGTSLSDRKCQVCKGTKLSSVTYEGALLSVFIIQGHILEHKFSLYSA